MDGGLNAPGYDEEAISADSSDDVQEVCYKNLVDRFLVFRDRLARSPNPAESSEEPLPNALQEGSRKADWGHDLKHTSPRPQTLLKASQSDIVRGLKRITSLLTNTTIATSSVRTNLACWTWTLLGRSRDVGTLDSDDVSVLRDLAKKALALASALEQSQMSLVAEDAPAENAEDNETQKQHQSGVDQVQTRDTQVVHGLGVSNVDPPVEAASELDDQAGDTLGVLDIIVTIVGDVFGQRDLLDLRQIWR